MFQLIDYLTIYKKPWSDLKEQERKGFNGFMINRILSMHPDLIEAVNFFQQYPNVPDQVCYNFWLKVLPNTKININFIKKKSNDVNFDLLVLLSKFFMVSTREMSQYMKLLKNEDVEKILKAMMLTDKEIKKLMK